MSATILVIEDNATNLELMSYVLKAFGHTALSARDGEEGIELAYRQLPDLIVCDVQLPKKDGYAIARELKSDQSLRNIPLVAVTALAMVGDRDKVLSAGFDGYIPKPIEPDTFVGLIDAFLRPEIRSTLQIPRETYTEEQHPDVAKRGTILVVDNVKDNISLMFSTLEPFGYDLVTAGTMEEGLALAHQSHPDLILSDVHMPDGDGYTFLRAAKANEDLTRIPFILISSTVWPAHDRDDSMRFGASKFIVRPIEPEALLAEIEACLKERKQGV
jgi:two-component system, cell cycle response regulator